MRLFLDLDGTLTDPGPGITRCFQHALGRMGRASAAPEELQRWIGPPLREAFASLLGTESGETVEQAVAFYRERFATVGLFENTPYPGVSEGLARLRGDGWRLLLVTAKPHEYARRIVARFGLDPHLDAVYGSELSGVRQDKGELIAHVLAEEGDDSEGTWMVGDRRHDVEAARANGLPALGVLWGYGSEVELREAGAALLLESMEELVGWAARQRLAITGSGPDAAPSQGRA